MFPEKMETLWLIVWLLWGLLSLWLLSTLLSKLRFGKRFHTGFWDKNVSEQDYCTCFRSDVSRLQLSCVKGEHSSK